MTADTYTNSIGAILMGTGNDINSWGSNLNSAMIALLDSAIAGRYTNSGLTGGNLAMDATVPPAGAHPLPQAMVALSGTLASNQTVTVPNVPKMWYVINGCTGAFSLKFKTTSGSAGPAIPQGGSAFVHCDGNNNIFVGLSTALRDVQWLGADGTVAAPGISFSSEPASGIYRKSAGIIGLVINGSEIAEISATGINVTSALALSVGGAPVPTVPLTYADFGTESAATLLGNPTGSPAVPSEIVLGANLSFSGSTLNAAQSPVAGPLGGAIGLVIKNNVTTPNSQIDMAADQVTMLNSSGFPIFGAGISVTVNTSTTGANGIDTGSRANSTCYNLFLISNGTIVAGLASLSATAPTLPAGYTYAVRLGAMLTDSSGNFFRTRQLGNRTAYTVVAATNTAAYRTITSGATGTLNTTTFTGTSTSLTGFAPPTATAVKVVMSATANNLSQGVAPSNTFAGTTSVNQVPYFVNGNGSTGTPALTAEVQLESANIFYAASGAGALLQMQGWTDKVNAC